MQPFCSITTGCDGGSEVRLPRPSFTYTNTFFNVPFGFTTTVSIVTGALCMALQFTSKKFMIFIGGGMPLKHTIPTMVAPFVATMLSVGGSDGQGGAGV